MRLWFVLVSTLSFASAINGSAQRTAADFIKQAETRERYKDYNGAIASCNQAIQLNPKDPKAYFERGAARFDRGDYEGAITQETKDFVHLRIWVIRTRTGQFAIANHELSFYFGQRSKSLSAKAGAFLLGKLSESELLKAANSSNPQKNRELRCLIWYYIGIKHLFAKETKIAKEYFTKCSAMGPLPVDESLCAQAELRILHTSG